MGGNIGGLFVYVLALMIMYYLLVDLQWIESELPVTRKNTIFEYENQPFSTRNLCLFYPKETSKNRVVSRENDSYTPSQYQT